MTQINIRHKRTFFTLDQTPAQTQKTPVFLDVLRHFLRGLFYHSAGFALCHSVAPAQIQLLTATLDLKLVQLLRGAMRAADGAGDKCHGLLEHPLIGRHVLHPTDRFEPRQVIDPTPRFEPRAVYHPAGRVEVPPSAVPTQLEPVKVENRTIPPVWKQPVWKCEPKIEVQIKRIVLKPDVQKRGTLIDLFM